MLFISKEKIKKIKKKIGADYIIEWNGIFGKNHKEGIVNLKTGEIIKEPFADSIYVADYIYGSSAYRIKNKWGIVNLKTGKIIKKPFADWIEANGFFGINDNKWGIINLKTGKIMKKDFAKDWINKNGLLFRINDIKSLNWKNYQETINN